MTEPEPLPDETPIAACLERGVGLVLSDPISDRVDLLVDYVEAAGERTSRKELIASLILNASTDGAELAAGIRRLRLARLVDAVPQTNRRRTKRAGAKQIPGPRARQPHAIPHGNE